MIEARFDDLTGAEPSFRLVGPAGVLEARRPDEVPGVLAAAEQAAARSLWVAGFVTYEAAPGLDAAFRVHARPPDGPFADLPLAWFAMFEGREETALPEPPEPPADMATAWRPTMTRAAYDAAIDRIHGAIADGDTYQVNFTLPLEAEIRGDPRGLYRDLAFAQRGRYGAYVDTGTHRVLSASPELFFRIDGDRITSRPMKGTAPRGRWLGEDETMRRGLERSVKDRAENAMIVDLLRNDIGRVARSGSVGWSDLFAAERYETVWQLTSTVDAELRPGVAITEVFAALFPCGSVTGAPKVSTMGIIADLEIAPRGVYCGTVGYLAPLNDAGPRARFNVAIRTVVQDARSGAAVYGVGGGITWDSHAAAEYDETVAKARVLTARRRPVRLLETLAHEPGTGYRRLDEHLDRLRSSATYLGMDLDEGAVRDALDREAGRFAKPARVRLVVDPRGRIESGSAPLTHTVEPVRLAIDRAEPVDPADPMLFHKTTARARYDRARERSPDADDVVLVNTSGNVTETTRANIAIRADGTWITPPLTDGLLPGCERAALLADGTLAEASVTIEDLERAEAVAFLNSVRGWCDAVLI
ncbi:MAG TPA: aminodeoxychorismate synthase component I [Actinomycetota bacterium]|nr:aminodeoxychorismate synthase component I [Actinomycetota bacterium]